MDQNKLDDLRNFYINNLREKESEETIKMLIVKDMLHILGYNKEWFRCEEPNMLGKSDILVTLPDNDMLYIEVKSKDYKINKKDYSQLSAYMDSTNTEWGIITNGNHYYLLNKSVNGKSEERVILEYLLIFKSGFKYSKQQNNINTKFFSYERIFKKKSTKYFAYFKEYIIKNRNHSNYISTHQYKSANFNFFNYLDINERICDESLLNPTRLIGYFDDIASKKSYKGDTLISKCNYIISTLKYLEDCGKLQTKHFNNFNSKIFLCEIINKYCDATSNEISPLTLTEARALLNYYSQNQSSYSRNKLLFKLYLFICPSIERIRNLTRDDFISRKNSLYLKINNYEFELPKSLVIDYNEYLNFRNKINCKYLFFTYYRQQYKQMTCTTIMSIINDSFNNIPNISEERKKCLNISTIQKSVISLMLCNGFSIEQISLFTELSVGTIYNYIDNETFKIIAQKTKQYLLSPKHPYAKILF